MLKLFDNYHIPNTSSCRLEFQLKSYLNYYWVEFLRTSSSLYYSVKENFFFLPFLLCVMFTKSIKTHLFFKNYHEKCYICAQLTYNLAYDVTKRMSEVYKRNGKLSFLPSSFSMFIETERRKKKERKLFFGEERK